MASVAAEQHKDVIDLQSFMDENLKPFSPFAYYDKHLDCIRVQILDCSITEERLSKFITFLRPTYPLSGQPYVGFTIKGIRHLFDKIGNPLEGVHSLTAIIDMTVKAFPHAAVKKVRDEFTGKLDGLNVDLAA